MRFRTRLAATAYRNAQSRRGRGGIVRHSPRTRLEVAVVEYRPKKVRKKPALIAVGALAGALVVIGHATSDGDSASTAASAPLTTASAAPIASSATVATPPPAPPTPAADTSPASENAPAALAKLDTLAIKGRAPKTGYDRDLFGTAWTDDVTVADGHNGCDTRNDILRRDLVEITLKPGSNGCAVLSGTLNDPDTGTTIVFQRGPDSSAQVQVDHVVALSDAWQKGAQQWHEATRRNFANDPINLQATDGATNQQKGDGDAATWLPPNKSYRCTYVSRIVDVKAAYGLWVTQPEHDAIARILTGCGVGAVPTTEAAPAPVDVDVPPSTALPPAPLAPSLPPHVEEGPSAYYPNCRAAKAAGAAPIYVGQPGYRSELDRNDDGVACER